MVGGLESPSQLSLKTLIISFNSNGNGIMIYLPRASQRKSPLGKTQIFVRFLIISAWDSVDSFVFDIASEESCENFSISGRHSSLTRRECSMSRILSVNLALWRPKIDTYWKFGISVLIKTF